MLMQCAITSGLRRPRNLSQSCRAARGPSRFCRKGGGGFSTWGYGGGGEAEASSGLPLEGRWLRSPLPRRVGEGGGGGSAYREGERPSLRAAGEARQGN